MLIVAENKHAKYNILEIYAFNYMTVYLQYNAKVFNSNHRTVESRVDICMRIIHIGLVRKI